jgi:hypothetical protein
MEAQRVVLHNRLQRILDETSPERLQGALTEWMVEATVEAYTAGYKRGRAAGWDAGYDEGFTVGSNSNEPPYSRD